jgi:hypothetical protein
MIRSARYGLGGFLQFGSGSGRSNSGRNTTLPWRRGSREISCIRRKSRFWPLRKGPERKSVTLSLSLLLLHKWQKGKTKLDLFYRIIEVHIPLRFPCGSGRCFFAKMDYKDLDFKSVTSFKMKIYLNFF